jgi:hypothetical protein
MGFFSSEALSRSLRTEMDWPRFVELVRVNSMVGPVLGGLLTADRDNVPESALAELKGHHRANVRRSLYLTGQLIGVVRSLDSVGIPAMSFKGPILSIDAYGDPSMRDSGDLDLLIRRTDMPAARNLLVANGFTPIFPTSSATEADYLLSLSGRRLARYVNSHSEHHLMRPEGRINVDLHWDITLRQFAVPLDSRGLWNNARKMRLGEDSISTPGIEDLLLILCINAAKDCWQRLDRVCDVAALISRKTDINFEALLCAARRAGAYRMVLVTFLLAREMLNSPLPEQVNREIAADRTCINLAKRIILRIFGPDDSIREQPTRLEETVMQLRARDQLHSRMRYLICQCYPTVGDWSALPLPDVLRFVHVLLRPLRLLLQFDGKGR